MAQSQRIRVTHYTSRDGLGSNVVNCGVQDRQGYLWFGTNHGLTRFDGYRFVNFYVEENGEMMIEGITHIELDTTHNVLLMSGKDYQLHCFDLTKMQFASTQGMSFPTDINEIKEEQALIARAKALGIDRGNRTNRRHDLHYARLDDGRELFATIDNGFFIYEPGSGQLEHYCSTDENPIIESDYTNGILQDRSGGIWLLTTFAGVYRLEMGEESLRQHSFASNIRSFALLDDHQLAVGDMEGNVYVYNTGTRDSHLLFHSGSRTYTMQRDSEGRLWIGTRGEGVHICILDEKSWLIRESKSMAFLPARQIYDIVFDSRGRAWIGTLDGGLIEAEELPDGSFSFTQHLKEEKIHELDFDDKGRLWIAAESGVWVMDQGQTRQVFNKGKAVCVCHDSKGTVYAGSNGYGLLRIANEQIEYIQVDNGLANNCVEAVTADDNDNVIAATDQGVSIINSTDGTIRNIYSSQGLRADTYNENAIIKDTKGRIFLGNLQGLTELKETRRQEDRNTRRQEDCSPRPTITSIEINDIPHYDVLDSKLRLSYDQNNLCFTFSSFVFNESSPVVYSYWLEGIDRDWHPSTKESKALYTNLSPGCYQLHVRSRLAGTTWSDEMVFEVCISQPWYWTWWARVTYLLLIALFVWYEWHQYRQRLSLRRQLDERLSALYAIEKKHQDPEPLPRSAELRAEASPPLKGREMGEDRDVKDVNESAKQRVANQRNNELLDKLDQLILQNLLRSDLDVNFIAQELCMSYSTLHRRIKSLTGMSANEYVRKHRLTKAMQLLRDGIPVTEVSMQCGFNSPSYFTRCFKSEYGILPSEV